jgi:hypothetical protein
MPCYGRRAARFDLTVMLGLRTIGEGNDQRFIGNGSGPGTRSTRAVTLACVCCVASLLLSDVLSYFGPGSEAWWSFPMFVNHCIFLAPIPAVLIVLRIVVATMVYALLLLAVLIARVVEVGHYLASGFLAKFTPTDFGALAIDAVSMFVVITWAADLFTQCIFNFLKSDHWSLQT